jgi:putative phage-type endonuclease
MTAELVGHFQHGSPEWHAARMGGIGGSEIAAVLGLSKWESHFSLWHRKQALIPDRPTNPDQEWGTRLEPVILQAFADNHPELVVDTNPGTWRNTDRPWQIANPDALAATRTTVNELTAPLAWTGEWVVVEAKNVNDRVAWEWDDGVPPYYLAQVRWYLDVFGLDRAIICALFGGSDYAEFEVTPDPDDTQLLRDAGADFMRSLAEGRRPDIDSHTETYTALRHLPDGLIDDKVEIPQELANQYEEALAMVEKWQDAKRLAASLMLDAIGNHRGATSGGRTIATRALRKGTNTTHSLKPARTL